MKRLFASALCLTLLTCGVFNIWADNPNRACGSSGTCTTGTTSSSTCCSSNPCKRNSCDSCTTNNNICSTNVCSPCDSNDDCQLCCTTPIRTYVQFRSQGANTARELVGWQWEINRPFMCENYAAAYFVFEYQRTFREDRLAQDLFGSQTLRFQGSQVNNRLSTSLLADYFGFSTQFDGTLSFCPRIESYIFDFGWYIGLDSVFPNSYIRIHAPIAHTRWGLNACPNITTIGDPFVQCYMNSTDQLPVTQQADGTWTSPGTTTATAQTFEQALSGTFLFGDMQEVWTAGRFPFCRQTKTGLADIDVILGYNFYNNDCSHFGLYLQAVLPTGNKPNDRFVFPPVVGNAKHFELGGGISAHHVLWSCENQNLALFLEGNVTHMFKNKQCRLFDFCKNGAFSRYLLLKEYDTDGTTHTYNGKLVNATVFANRSADVRIDVKGDVSIKLAYHYCNFAYDLGYNVYGHSRERVSLREEDCGCAIDQRSFAVKGTQDVCCFNYPVVCCGSDDPSENGQCPDGSNSFIFPNGKQGPLTGSCALNTLCGSDPTTSCDSNNCVLNTREIVNNTSQPCATAFRGVPIPTTTPSDTDSVVNNCVVSVTGSGGQVTNGNGVEVNNFGEFTTAGLTRCINDAPIRFLTVKDLNERSAESPAVLTHKVFGHFFYTWYDDCGWNPHFGVGAEAEFSGKRKNSNPSSCERLNFNQWGVWIKTGISF